jgi:hypothetical protein
MFSTTQLLIGAIILLVMGYLAVKGTAYTENLTCNATCDSFNDCGLGRHLKPPYTECAGSKCTAEECCTPNPTCKSMDSCPSGRTFKPNYKNLGCKGAACQDSECCDPIGQPTCKAFPCPTHATIRKNIKDITCAGQSCTDTECCSENPKPTCYGNNIKCPTNYYLQSNAQKIQCNDYTCTTAECCSPNPTCSSIQCGTGHYSKDPSTICKGSVCEQPECCNPNPICSSFSCKEGDVKKVNANDITCLGATCTNIECCDCGASTPSTSIDIEDDLTNIYFPGATFITFDGEKNTNKKQDSNSDIYNYSKYDNWTTPYQTKSYQTNNMFSTIPVKTAPTGISAFNTTSYNQA